MFPSIRRPIPAVSKSEGVKNMRITSILRTAALALALGASLTSIAPAFADGAGASSRFQRHQDANTGVYDGPAWEAAKNQEY
jgi:hypothetical protein